MNELGDLYSFRALNAVQSSLIMFHPTRQEEVI